MNTTEKMAAYERALQKVLDDSEIGVVPAAHISHISRLLHPEPKVIWVNEASDGTLHAYKTEDIAKGAITFNTLLRRAVKYQEVVV